MSPVQSFEIILVLLAIAVGLAVLARRLHIPTAVVFVLGGMVLAITPGLPEIRLDPDLTMVLFLPPLLMASAYFTSWRAFRANLRPILLLAVGAVAFTTGIVAVVLHTLIPSLPWAACFAFGAIVSPPDAIAAASILERLRMPRRMVTILSGESLVNDASGLVLYRFAVAATMTGLFDPTMVKVTIVGVAVGGVVVGILAGMLLVWLAQRLRDTHMETAASFLAAWGSYIVAEQLHVSGVLATVACGVWFGFRRHEALSAPTRLEAAATWSFVVFVMDALVFILIGLSLQGVLDRIGPGEAAQLAPVALAVLATVIIGRFVWVFPAAHLSRPPWVRKRDPVPSVATLTVISWAGMRGVVSLAAALALPAAFPGRDTIIILTFAVILGTVLIQGVTLGPLIKALGLSNSPPPATGPMANTRPPPPAPPPKPPPWPPSNCAPQTRWTAPWPGTSCPNSATAQAPTTTRPPPPPTGSPARPIWHSACTPTKPPAPASSPSPAKANSAKKNSSPWSRNWTSKTSACAASSARSGTDG